jgi:hypothetical protein
MAQPIFHPVKENVFPNEFIVTVRSNIPGKEAIEMCSISNANLS